MFFSPPEPKANAEAAAVGAAAAPAGGLASTAQEVALILGPELARLSAASEEAAAAMLAQQNSIVSALWCLCTSLGQCCRPQLRKSGCLQAAT